MIFYCFIVTFPQFNNSMRYHQKSFDSAMTSIEKPKLLNNRVGKSLIKSRTIEITRYKRNISIHIDLTYKL